MKGIIPSVQSTANTLLLSCDEIIHSPCKRLIRNPEQLAQLAHFYVYLDLSGNDVMDWILKQIYYGHKGALIDYNGNEIDRSKWFVEELFAEEPEDWLDKFMLGAKVTRTHRLQQRCVNRVMAMYFALDIHLASYG